MSGPPPPGNAQAERLLLLIEQLIVSNQVLAREVQQLRETLAKMAGGNVLAGLLKALKGR